MGVSKPSVAMRLVRTSCVRFKGTSGRLNTAISRRICGGGEALMRLQKNPGFYSKFPLLVKMKITQQLS